MKSCNYGRLLITLFLLLTMALVACGPDAEGENDNEADQQNSSDNNSVTVAIEGDIQNFNPYTNQTVDYLIIRHNVFEPLIKFDASMELVPNLAIEWTQESDLKYTFTLREDVTFQNGQEFSGEDVKYSIEMIQDKNNASYFAPFFQEITDVEVNGNELTIELANPSPALLNNLASLPIIAEGTMDDLDSNPIGTGPFKFESWSAGDKTVLTRNENYWNGETTNIEELIIRPIDDSAVRYNNLTSGTIDIINSLSPSQMTKLEEEDNYYLLEPSSSNETALVEVVIKNNEAFKNPLVMQALTHALDKEVINENIYQGYGSVLWSPFPSNNFAYKPGKEYPFDLDKARSLLEEAGYSSGLSFTLILPSGMAQLEQIAVMWQANLSEIGVDMEIEVMELNNWVNKYLERSYEMTLNFYPQAGSDPSIYTNMILKPLVEKSLDDPSEMLDLIDRGATTTDEKEREKIYAEIQDMVSENGVIIPILETPIAAGVSNRISDLEIFPTSVLYLGNAKIKE